jgi:hypothetical protein
MRGSYLRLAISPPSPLQSASFADFRRQSGHSPDEFVSLLLPMVHVGCTGSPEQVGESVIAQISVLSDNVSASPQPTRDGQFARAWR